MQDCNLLIALAKAAAKTGFVNLVCSSRSSLVKQISQSCDQVKSIFFIDLDPNGQSPTPKLLVLFSFGTVVALFRVINSGPPWKKSEVSDRSLR